MRKVTEWIHGTLASGREDRSMHDPGDKPAAATLFLGSHCEAFGATAPGCGALTAIETSGV